MILRNKLMLSCLLFGLLAHRPAIAATLTRVEVSTATPVVGVPMTITAHKSGSGSCGFEVDLGGGSTLGPFGIPSSTRAVPHTFSVRGRSTIRIRGARRGAQPGCGGSPAAVEVFVGDPAGPPLRANNMTPAQVVIGSPSTLNGAGFGERASVTIHLTSAAGLGGPIAQIRADQILSWSDTRIEMALPITEEGRYGLQLSRTPSGGGGFVETGDHAGISFDAALPRPRISGYQPGAVCPGDFLSIRGSNFTNLRDAFMVLWEKIGEDRNFSISVRSERIGSWADDEIRFTVPTDLPVYVEPGVRFRISLARRVEHGVSTAATGPIAQLNASCGPPEPMAPGRTPAEGAGRSLTFQLAPLQKGVKVGGAIVFGGTFVAPSGLGRALSGDPAQVEWTIRRGASQVATGLLDVRGRRTPWLGRGPVEHAGTYRLELRLLSAPRGMTLEADLEGAQVVVPAILNRQVDPKNLRKKPDLPVQIQQKVLRPISP